jgi:N-acetyltransferase
MNYLEPVTLRGKHIQLEPLEPAVHAEPMFLHFEPAVTQYLSRGGKPIENATDLANHLLELNALPKRLNCAVAGRISYSDTNPKDRWIEVGTMLMPAFWGGYANPEGKLLLLTRAFEVLGANRVQFKVDARNQRSQGSMAKLGAVREGVLRQYQIRPDGFMRDSVMYSILASEWAGVKQKLEARL